MTALTIYPDSGQGAPKTVNGFDASYEDEDSRVFTFHLRKGHKWSDGHPFTTEDFRYFWEDVANNEKLSPFGPSNTLLVDDQPPKVEIIDEYTIRYSWQKPNPFFLTARAGARHHDVRGRRGVPPLQLDGTSLITCDLSN